MKNNVDLLNRIDELEEIVVELAADFIRNSDNKEVIEKETIIKEKPVKGDPGEDGVSVDSVNIVNNNVIVKLSNGKEFLAGKINVPNIDKPPHIKDVYSDADYRLIIEMSNGHVIRGPLLPKGQPGEMSEPLTPNMIVNAHIDGGELVLEFNDDTKISAGKLPKTETIIKTGGGGGAGKAFTIEYVRDNIEARLPDSEIIVKQQSDFGECIDGVIVLGDYNYVLDNLFTIDCELYFPEGSAVAITSSHRLKNFMIYTGSGTLFSGNPQRLEFNNTVILGNPNATLFDLTASNDERTALILNTCVFSAFGTVGVITDIRTFASFNSDLSNFTTGLTVNATKGSPDWIWAGGRIENDPVFTAAVVGITFTGLVSLVNIASCQVRLNTNQYAFKFDNSLNIIDDVKLSNCPVTTSLGGELVDPTGRTYDDVDITLSDNPSVRNSAHVGGYYITGNTTQTVITTADTYTSSGLSPTPDITNEGFSVSGSVLTSTAKEPDTKTAHINGNISMVSGSSKVIHVGLFKNNILMFDVIVTPDPTGTKTGIYIITLSLFMEKDDMLEVKYKNVEGTGNILIENETLTLT